MTANTNANSNINANANNAKANTKHRALEILEDLIRIQSVNPHYGDGAKGEGEVADYIEARCRQAGLSVRRQTVLPGRDNLIVEIRTGKPGGALLFESHMDTVSIGSMENALVPTYLDGKLYGRGACDTKATLAGMLYAMEECAKIADQLPRDLVFCASVDEEHAFRGLAAFMELDLPFSGAVVGEPTELGIVVEHKGCARFTVHTHGKAAHSSMPQEGDNAVYQMMQVLRFITEIEEPKLNAVHSRLSGSPTIVVGTIQGGKQINIVPESCVIEVDRRIIPGETPEQVLQEFEQQLLDAVKQHEVKASVEPLLLDPALNTPHDSAIVRASQEVAQSLGLQDQLCGVPYGSDASKLQQWKGIPTIVYGPGSIAQAHSKEEWVPVDEVGQAAEFYLQLAKSYKGQ
ncbi:M20 family metallopeptidase [Paenibacillus eucommiae]|uniref:Probable succinyl-diaminopimelate desuccinylase n=1 Tax=Paenibacillus eucommiae TaxID=1355755 RepID=A0ABS4IQ69_9BACL|nr:M20 family metallopeptidase [Paenibacillus eucommiae]MBP1988754.1 acetylornithine deacetylase [Paenibacillus eucommiae]